MSSDPKKPITAPLPTLLGVEDAPDDFAPPSASVKSPSQLAAYASLFDRMLDSTFLVDPNTYIVLEANDACERLLGVPVEKLVGRAVTMWAEESQRDDFSKALRVAMRRYYPRQFDSKWRLPTGQALHMEVLACPLSLSDGSSVLQVMVRDVSFKRESEAKLQALLTELQAANAKLEILSTVDEMTGLFNFRHFKSELQKEHVRAQRFAQPYAIVFCDLDHFKHYNDRNGHPAGDRLLQAFAGVLSQTCRSSDLVARYGGEEFAVICPASDAKGAMRLAERLKIAITGTRFDQGEHQPMGFISCSIGVATYPDHGRTAEEVLKAADEAVYVSKRAGRNQATLSQANASKKAS